jgi:hypothetical protein
MFDLEQAVKDGANPILEVGTVASSFAATMFPIGTVIENIDKAFDPNIAFEGTIWEALPAGYSTYSTTQDDPNLGSLVNPDKLGSSVARHYSENTSPGIPYHRHTIPSLSGTAYSENLGSTGSGSQHRHSVGGGSKYFATVNTNNDTAFDNHSERRLAPQNSSGYYYWYAQMDVVGYTYQYVDYESTHTHSIGSHSHSVGTSSSNTGYTGDGSSHRHEIRDPALLVVKWVRVG